MDQDVQHRDRDYRRDNDAGAEKGQSGQAHRDVFCLRREMDDRNNRRNHKRHACRKGKRVEKEKAAPVVDDRAITVSVG